MSALPSWYPEPTPPSASPSARPRWAQLLIDARIAAGWTVREVARQAALHWRTLMRIENTDGLPPSRYVLADLARGLGMDEEEQARLLVAAGYWPDDPTCTEIAQLLFGDVMPVGHRRRFREQVHVVAARYERGGRA